MKLPVKYRGQTFEVEVDEDDGNRILTVLNGVQPETNSLGRTNGWCKRKRCLSYVPAWKNRGFRPAIWVDGKLQYLSRWLLGVTGKDAIVDHIDQNPLNNKRDNLRIVGRCENAYNSGKMGWERPGKSSKYRGVIWSKQCKKWQGIIHLPNRKNKSAFFSSEEDAARWRDSMLVEILGINNCLNFPIENKEIDSGTTSNLSHQ